MAKRSNEGIVVFAVLVITVLLLQTASQMLGIWGLGGQRYGVFSLLLLLAAGTASYFAVSDAGLFKVKDADRALYYAGLALLGAVMFTWLLLSGSGISLANSFAAPLTLACAAPLIVLGVRQAGGKRKEREEGGAGGEENEGGAGEGGMKEAPQAVAAIS